MTAKCASSLNVYLAAAILVFSAAANADLGVTDNCQDEVKELDKKIENNQNDYTSESRSRARAELAKARTNRLDPIKCRKNVQDARQELRKGKRDNRDD